MGHPKRQRSMERSPAMSRRSSLVGTGVTLCGPLPGGETSSVRPVPLTPVLTAEAIATSFGLRLHLHRVSGLPVSHWRYNFGTDGR